MVSPKAPFRVSAGALALIAKDVPAGARAIVQEVVCAHGWRVEWTGADPRAHFGRRVIYAAPIVDERTAAIALHECGHVVAGLCPAAGLGRFADKAGHQWVDGAGCLLCETAAWALARRWLPLTRSAFELLQRSLGSYQYGRTGRFAPETAWQAGKYHLAGTSFADDRLQRAHAQTRHARLMAAIGSLQEDEARHAPTLNRLRKLAQLQAEVARESRRRD